MDGGILDGDVDGDDDDGDRFRAFKIQAFFFLLSGGGDGVGKAAGLHRGGGMRW